MKLYLIALPVNQDTTDLLKISCLKYGVECITLDPSSINPIEMKLNPGDALYRSAVSSHNGCLELEYQLINDQIATFYKDNNPLLINRDSDSFLLEKNGVSIPKMANFIPRDRDALKSVVEKLGGFPIIIKKLGGSHGVGVMRVDSFESLFSVSDALIDLGGRYVLKQYIDVKSAARLIVLGDQVVDSIEYRANVNDFRSNEGAVPNVYPAKFDEKIQILAIQAVSVLGLEFGGVDILISNDQAYVTEVNFPCFFARCQNLTNTNISDMMLEHLLQKSHQ